MNIYAYTPTNYASYPPYLSVNEEAGKLVVRMRGQPSHGAGGHAHAGADVDITIPAGEAYGLALGLMNWLLQLPARRWAD